MTLSDREKGEAAFAEGPEAWGRWLDEHEAKLNSRPAPEQHAISYGDYWFRIAPEIGLIIFGKVFDEEELDATGDLETAEELAARGYRYGRAYSLVCPDGEAGDTHVSVMIPFPPDAFEAALEANWSVRNMLAAAIGTGDVRIRRWAERILADFDWVE